MEYNNNVSLQITDKGRLFIAFYEALENKLSKEELNMELWNKFWDRYCELGGENCGV